jgi:formylglycine-generating enzyme required for sulfatase activity
MSNINKSDAEDYCKWLSQKTKHKYRLPTEAEWEYAARGGANGISFKFSGGNDKHKVSWNEANSGGEPHKVGRRDANSLGIYDMTGNVWEWCSDMYSPTYYKVSPTDNPKGASPSPKVNLGVLRGGSYKSYQKELRVTNRLEFMPTGSAKDFGFRVVREL